MEQSLNKLSRVPLYYQLKQILLSRIAGMKHHGIFPSEHDLVNEFNVSRGTVKQAIVELVNEGYLYRTQGKGTFVSPPRIERNLGALPSFTDDISRKGYIPETVVRSLELQDPSPHVKAALDLPPDVSTWMLNRVVLADRLPVTAVTSYLRADVYPDLGNQKLSVSLYKTLEAMYGEVPTSARDLYEVHAASQQLASVLSVRRDSPVIFSKRIAYLSSGLPVEYVESYMRADRFVITVSMNPTGDSMTGVSIKGRSDTDS